MELEDLQRELDRFMEEQNNRSVPEFLGYSPFEMHKILHFTFEEGSPIRWQRMAESDYSQIPLLNQVRYLLNLIEAEGSIRLTASGYLPLKYVKEIHQQGFIPHPRYELSDTIVLRKELDSHSIHLTRILVEISGLVKKRKGSLSLTAKSRMMLNDPDALLRKLFDTYTKQFNWAYNDGYGESPIGQLGWGFSLILLSRYGDERRPDTFYADKYFQAFPDLLETAEPTYSTLERYVVSCYSLRTFTHFMEFFGLVYVDRVGKRFEQKDFVRKSELFDRWIRCAPHKKVRGNER